MLSEKHHLINTISVVPPTPSTTLELLIKKMCSAGNKDWWWLCVAVPAVLCSLTDDTRSGTTRLVTKQAAQTQHSYYGRSGGGKVGTTETAAALTILASNTSADGCQPPQQLGTTDIMLR